MKITTKRGTIHIPETGNHNTLERIEKRLAKEKVKRDAIKERLLGAARNLSEAEDIISAIEHHIEYGVELR